jgi:hypothetical protein
MTNQDLNRHKVTGLDSDSVHELLSNERRRFVLRRLRDTPTTSKSCLADRLAAYESNSDTWNAQARKRALIGLHQCHLPKLADRGVIAYDRQSGRVTRGEHYDQVVWYLDNGPEKQTGFVKRVRKAIRC